MKEQWLLMAKKADFYAIGRQFGIDPVTARIIRNRELKTEEEIAAFLDNTGKGLHDPHLLKDVERAAVLVCEGINRQQRIRIIGDYDIDGVNATYILLTGIRRCGGIAEPVIPDRIRDGYGINREMVTQAAKEGAAMLITCDNGIAAYEEIAYAKELGLTVVVTDHHEVPFQLQGGEKKYRLPPADAVVNPKQQDCGYPYPGLCGAAVAWKFIQVLYEQMGVPVTESNEMLAHVAFATVGDVMDLTGENRILVKLGLQAIHQTKNPGLLSLIKKNNLEPEQIKAWHFGFILGPCINASGRLDTARRSLQLLLEDSFPKASRLAEELVELNARRKELTLQGVEEAERVIEAQGLAEDKVMVIYLPQCHESLAGIIAGRIREHYHHPVFVLTRAEGGGVKGSGRSIESYSMYEEMSQCSELFTRFGGHPMAAGLSMEEEKVPVFRERINALARLSEEDFVEKIYIDVPMPLSYIRPELVREFACLEPFGKGNAKPVFAVKKVHPRRGSVVGKNRNVLKLWLEDGSGGSMPAVYFGDIEAFFNFLEEKFSKAAVEALLAGREQEITFSMIYEPSLSIYQGMEQLEVILRHYC